MRTLILLTFGLWLGVSAQGKSLQPLPARDNTPVVQIALLLDTSNSMDGLIEQAKSQLWKIVNEFIQAKHDGKRPELQVALFEYGNNSLSAAEGYVRQIQGFTTDLDKLSEELFRLKTNGGEEYCGWVIKAAVDSLSWSRGPNDLKTIFIAGNEPFTQGPVSYADACRAAIEKGIMVNTIHCGDEATGIRTKWQQGALMAEGKYMVIDQNRAVAHIEAPQDKEISRLGEQLNRTYVAFGSQGRESQVRQELQDRNAAAYAPAGASVQRALTKASANYQNEKWDLVDASLNGTVVLEKLEETDLPNELRGKSVDERKRYVAEQSAERAKIKEQIVRLNAERSKFVAEKSKEHATPNTLDAAITAAVREQASRRNYRFE